MTPSSCLCGYQLELVCDCGLLIAELAQDTPLDLKMSVLWRHVGYFGSILISLFIFRSLWKRLPKKD